MENIKTRRIKSKKEKNLIKLDIIIAIICIIIAVLDNQVSIIEYLKIPGINFIGKLNLIIFYLWSLLIVAVSDCFIIIAVYLAFRILRMKKIKENSKYEVIDNIQYYRERFSNITPTEISLITDLEIERKKDITATILSLYQKGIIDFEENNIIIKDETKHLKNSEQEVLNMIKNNDFGTSRMNSWENTCINEAIQDNYIKDKIKKKTKHSFIINNLVVTIAIILIIISFCLCVNYVGSDNGKMLLDSFSEYDQYSTNVQSDIDNLLNNSKARDAFVKIFTYLGPCLFILSIMIISIFIIIATPFYRFAKKIINTQIELNDNYERTKEGKILVEQIAGIKNYIHDFSLLSEKDKEGIALWEDFLIYAVVLEENEKIIEDIYRYKNINIGVLGNIKQIINI